jgi:hypothetical protein
LCPRFEHTISALHYGFTVVVGVFWGKSDRLDSDGWLAGSPMGGIAGGHAVICFAPVWRIGKNGRRQYGVLALNSWGKEWGMDGWFVIPEERFVNSPFTGAWAGRSVSPAKGDLDRLPMPKNLAV